MSGFLSISDTLRRRGEESLASMVDTYAQEKTALPNMNQILDLVRRGLHWGIKDVLQAIDGFSKLSSMPYETTAAFFRLLGKWSKMSLGRTGNAEFMEVTKEVAAGLRKIFYASAVTYAVYRAVKWVAPRAKEQISKLIAKIKRAATTDEIVDELKTKDNKQKQDIVESLLAAGYSNTTTAAILPIEIIAYEGKTYNLSEPEFGVPGKRKSNQPIINPQPPATSRTQPIDQVGEDAIVEVPEAVLKPTDTPSDKKDKKKDKKKEETEDKEASVIEIRALEVPEGEELVIHETYGRQPFFKKPWRKDVDPEYLERKHKILRKLKKRKLDDRTERISSLL